MDVVSAGQEEWQKDHQQKPRYLQAQTGHQLDVCHHKNIQKTAVLTGVGQSPAKDSALLENSLSWKFS